MRLIDASGKQVGVVSFRQAIRMAQEAGLDLVEVAPGVNPPVCRIMDFKKFKYEQEKREREAKKHQRGAHLKEIRLKPYIEEHDYQTKLRQILKFLEKGDKVRVRLIYRGRDLAHPEKGKKLIDRVIEDTSSAGKIDKPPQRFERMWLMILAPK